MSYWCTHIHVGSSAFLHDQYTQQDHQWQEQVAETSLYGEIAFKPIQILERFSEKYLSIIYLVCDAIHFKTGYHLEVLSYTFSVRQMQYACAQNGTRRVLLMPSLVHWSESNLPFFEYLLWERCWWWWSLLTYMERWVHLWLAAAMPELRLKSPVPRTHLLAQFSWLPGGNWHIPLLIIKVMRHVYS